MFHVDCLLVNASLWDQDGQIRPHHALGILNDTIVWRGSMQDLPDDYSKRVLHIYDMQDQLVTPGLIDCHTHLVFAKDRADEFKMRFEGKTYQEIAAQGGGILSTVTHVRQATEDDLLQQSLPRLLALKSNGVTTVEIKSGYGLAFEHERKMLRVARRLGEVTGIRVCTTFLGAHAVAPEFRQQKQAYVDYLCRTVLPQLAAEGLVDAVDVFCESIAFSTQEAKQMFETAMQYHLPVKCHAEQLSNIGATKMACEFRALSCDHVEYLDEAGAEAMAASGTVAVLLPGAYYFLKEKKAPPVPLLREKGVDMAIATDCNPGSSPTTSLLLMMNMACQLFAFTPREALNAVTVHAAKALGLSHVIGTLSPGMKADLVCWSLQNEAQLCYYFGHPLPHKMMIAGQWLG